MKRLKIVRQWPGFLLGVLTALALSQGVTLRERLQAVTALDKCYAEAQYWQKQAIRLKAELGSINRKSEARLYIQNVSITVIKSPVPAHEAVEALAPYTRALLGLSLQYLKLPVLYHMFNNRIVVIGTHLYEIRVQALLLDPHTELIISVHPNPSSSSL